MVAGASPTFSTFGNYGLTPEKGSFVIQAGIVAHYMDGGYYPVGGSQEISKALIPTIEAAGGAVFVRVSLEKCTFALTSAYSR